MKSRSCCSMFRYQKSPSMRREWIEISCGETPSLDRSRSPSMRREWIEMCAAIMYAHSYLVSLHAEGVD